MTYLSKLKTQASDDAFSSDAELGSEVARLLKSLKFPGQDVGEELRKDNLSYCRSYDVPDYFSWGDDDWPDFVGEQEAEAVVKKHFASVAEKVDVLVNNIEKGFFGVYVSPKKVKK